VAFTTLHALWFRLLYTCRISHLRVRTRELPVFIYLNKSWLVWKNIGYGILLERLIRQLMMTINVQKDNRNNVGYILLPKFYFSRPTDVKSVFGMIDEYLENKYNNNIPDKRVRKIKPT